MITFDKLKKVGILLIIFMTFNCTIEKDKFNTIKELSDITIPDNSTIIIYNDNLELELAFKVLIKKKELHRFLKIYNFKNFYLLEKNPLTMGNTNKLLIYNIENSFSPREKIMGENLKILKNKKGTLIINCDTHELWGLVSY